MSETLVDLSSTGRPRPWVKHKQSNEKLSNVYDFLNSRSKSKRLEECGSMLVFEECPEGHHKRLKYAYFCKQRLCAMCAWRRSLFVYHQFLMVAHEVIKKFPDYQFIFITLTVKNCPEERLSKEITHLIESFDRLRGYKRFNSIKGTFRTNEVTYNPLNKDYHPHIHAIGVVPPSYFTHGYISQEELIQLWKKALQVDYEPNVDIRKVRSKRSGVPTVNESLLELENSFDTSLSSAAAEVAKYSVKVSDIIESKPKPTDSPEMVKARLSLSNDIKHQASVIDTLDNALNRRRMISYTGVFKDAYKALNQKDVEDSDFIVMPGESRSVCNCSICQSELVQIHYHWDSHIKNYKKEK